MLKWYKPCNVWCEHILIYLNEDLNLLPLGVSALLNNNNNKIKFITRAVSGIDPFKGAGS